MQIDIIDFEPRYAADFKRLNLVWLDGNGLTEAPDLAMLNDPQKEILDGGGYIFLACAREEIVGTAALIANGDHNFELAKMTVSPAFQGQGISRRLMDACLEKARQLGARRLYLESSTKLTTALKLYEKYGFQNVPITNSHYKTADVMMEIKF